MRNLKLLTLISNFVAIFVCTHAYADLPLKVEDLITDKKRFKFTANFAYQNQYKTTTSQQSYTALPLANGTVLQVPRPIRIIKNNNDTLQANVGIKYGVTNSLEVGINNTGYHNEQRSFDNLNINTSNRYSQWQSLGFDTQYQLTKNHTSFADSVLFAKTTLYDTSKNLLPKYFSNATFGIIALTVNDPIALSTTASYTYNAPRYLSKQKQHIHIGDTVTLAGMVGFSVNPDITLNTTVNWQAQWESTIKNKKVNSFTTSTNLGLGMAYAVTQRTNITANIQANISGNNGSQLSFGITSKLGKLPESISQKYRQAKNKSSK